MTRPRLTRERILTAAFELADSEGLHAVSLRRVAAELKVHVMSLYNHVATKEAVLDGLAERLTTEAGLPTEVTAWDEWIWQFAASMRAVARRHPGAFEVLHHRQLRGADAVVCAEAALAAFRRAGFGEVEAYSAFKATSLVVLGLVLEELASVRDPYLQTNLSELPLERFPHLHAAGAIAAKTDTWTYLIDALIAGIEANHSRQS